MRNLFQFKNVSVGRTSFFFFFLAPLSLLFKTVMGETASFIMSAY